MTEKIKFAGLDIQVVNIDGEVYVPIKFFMNDYQLNFDRLMLWFNDLGYSEKLDKVMHYIGEDDYLCFYIEDFAYMLVMLSAKEKMLFRNAIEITALYAKKYMDKEYRNDILKFIGDTFRVPEPTDDNASVLFLTSSEILDSMPAKMKEGSDSIKIGLQMRYLNMKKTTHYSNGQSKWGYLLVRR